MRPVVSIILVSFNTREMLRQALASIAENAKGISYEVFVVDNASQDGSAQMVREEFPQVKLIESSTNIGFAAGNNLAIQKCQGEYVLLFNPDSILSPQTLHKTVGYMQENRECGVLGIKLKNEVGVLQPCARKIPNPWYKFLVISGIAHKFRHSKLLGGPDYSWWNHSEIRTVGWVVGAYFLIRREVIEKIGHLDERYFLYFEEIDFCLQNRKAGWQVVFYPHAEVVHIGGQSSANSQEKVSSSGKQLVKFRVESEFRFYRKNFSTLHVLLAFLVEYFWHKLIILKNRLFSKQNSKNKISHSQEIIHILKTTLRQDNWGKGR
ncbi:MAG: glycosyltransferase family 2 protein [Spirochaetota bacterium]